MHSWRFLRKSSSSAHPNLVGCRPINLCLLFRKSKSSLSTSYDQSSHDREDRFDSFARWVSSGALVVVGSGIAYYCWPSLPSNYLPTNAMFSFADSQKQADHPEDSKRQDSESKKKPKYIFGEAYRRRIFFNYEKRIRMQSPPEKVFEYFASLRTPEGEVLMTPADLMRAVVPVFSPSESNRVRVGHLRGEKCPGDLHCAPSNFFMLFDTNKDGYISFPEYIFFVTLLSIPESSFSAAFKMFDLDNNGAIDMDEFKKVMGLMRGQNRQGVQHRDGLRVGLKVADPVENGGLVEYFFGEDGNGLLEHTKFVGFLRDLHDEMLRLEFAHYDCKLRGTIPAKDFALSLVASADICDIDKFLDRVEELDDDDSHLSGVRITVQEFRAFADLRKQLQPLSIAIFCYGKVNGLLTRNDFQRAAAQVCGISLTDNVVDIIFHVFDANRDGSLSADEFVKVLQRREGDISQQPRDMGFMG